MKQLLILFSITFLFSCTKSKKTPADFDVIVIGGGASGTMAGIQAARLGSKALILEETPWLGGMLTSAGVSAIDGNYRLYSGLWQEFREALYQHYGGEDSVKSGWVSNVLFEPHVAAEILLNMAEREDQLEINFQSEAESIEYTDGYWEVSFGFDGDRKKVRVKILIDGTELGDVSKMVGISYDIGMDAREVTGEDIAPKEANEIIQDLTYVAILKDYGDDHRLIEKPDGYDPEPFYCTCAGICDQDTISRKLWSCEQMMNYGRLPNDYYMINWPIFGNDYYVNAIELDEEGRADAFKKAKWYTKCYVYYIQNELGFKHLGIANDVFPTEDGFPLFPYHRESRRIHGLVQFDINDLARPFLQEDALYRTGIAVGDYPVDHHHEAYPEHEQLPDLHFYPVPSYSLPLGTLIPKKVNNFITAEKSISVTNLVNGTTRLQPVCLLIGQAAGVLAHLAANQDITPGKVAVRQVQELLLENGAYLMPYSDVHPEDESFNAIQRIGATGILRGEGKNIGWENHTLFHPDSALTIAGLADGLQEFDSRIQLGRSQEIFTWEAAMNLVYQIDSLLSIESEELDKSVARISNKYSLGEGQPITRKQFAVLLDATIDPFHLKQIDHRGLFVD